MQYPTAERWKIVILTLSLILCVAGQLSAGQVVTPELRQWAHQAIVNEAALSFEPDSQTVAVLYFHNRTGRTELDLLEKGLALMLITDLAKIDNLEVIERARLQALIQELELGASGLVDTDTTQQMGRFLGARHLVGGIFEGLPSDSIGIDSDILNVPLERLTGTAHAAGALEELLRMEKELLFEIVRLLGMDLTAEEEEALRQPIAEDIKALMLLFQGIEHSDLGDYDTAAASYRKALELEPGMDTARAALQELIDMRLISPPNDTDALLRHLHQQISVNTGPTPNAINRRQNFQPATANINVQW
ncbi:CsgG/HfaB family protein [Desulfatitalea alkaliphila]|uniref:Tetratricopeptide repeat protein n=1 Tax=Desulfatitalea alkaliphila TaxID=2929485 RepID=A0AA41RAZ9_9BACT|nr:CsgG/HfaB family protein [Desulfatitalea alkaliphila]MCJ8501848.1 hypothetical protein [Desulfatitalea alkaliphila]